MGVVGEKQRVRSAGELESLIWRLWLDQERLITPFGSGRAPEATPEPLEHLQRLDADDACRVTCQASARQTGIGVNVR